MKCLALFITLFFWFITGHACAISPFYQIVTEPDRYVGKSNAVFFGRLIEIDNSGDNIQVAEFQVLEVFKGNLKTNIRIVNKIETDCSRTFSTVGTHYYVFGNPVKNESEIIMNGFPGFVPERYAKKMNLLNKLQQIK